MKRVKTEMIAMEIAVPGRGKIGRPTVRKPSHEREENEKRQPVEPRCSALIS